MSSALAHVRVGSSPSLLIENEACSVCDKPTRECLHLIGETYDGRPCYRLIKKAKILHIAYVSRPLDPDARISRVSVPSEVIDLRLKGRPPGMRLSCDFCERPCPGVREIDPALGDVVAQITGYPSAKVVARVATFSDDPVAGELMQMSAVAGVRPP